MWFDYTHALVRGLPESFPDSLKLHPPPEPIDMPKASAWHGLSGLLHSCTARRVQWTMCMAPLEPYLGCGALGAALSALSMRWGLSHVM